MSMKIEQFYKKHDGETALLVGNGPNLGLTPPEKFNYPSFGMNTIYNYKSWKPDYYVAVDEVFFDMFEQNVQEAFPDTPKFIPAEFIDRWSMSNMFPVTHRNDGVFVRGDMLANKKESLTKGVNWKNVMHLSIQLAWYMGFTTILMIGVQQKPGVGSLREHFWGIEELTPVTQNDVHWNAGYKAFVSAMTDIKVLNISEDTYVPEDVIPRDDWKKWVNA